ncbi:putative phage protein gp47/JayE [Candidatus Methanophagaceae archaeon]|nr:putative phage protein gp47/JayE [Methanophagales archaeon]
MKSEPPKIDDRKFSDLLKMTKGLVPHYTPEWAASDENDSGVALLNIFCHITENVVNRFNQVPHKNFVAFLDMLGIKLLQAQPARVPLTFKLAEGTEKEILIPERTQAAADKTEEHEELPFETEKKLLGIPSLLKKVISVDPKKDDIYLTPPGFLNGEPQTKSQVTYKIVSSPSAGARNIQLDHVTDLKEDDFLKIINGDKTEYVVISNTSGTIVNITNSLIHAYPANTPVEKLTRFSLFEGKNMQEHSLHIGHKDLFNIKSTAQFSLDITHLAGTEVGVTPLKLSWEYWGEKGGEEEEGEDWRKFNTIDGTQGFSKDGQIALVKTTDGEIKEKEINGVNSRWIRCFVEEPLPVDVPRRLPMLDNIVFVVKSSGKNQLPDQAFNNVIPIDITQPFTPFGQEPRMFDNFSIGSKEIFSKKGAKIEIDVKVEPRGILAAPTAIEYKQKIKVFARGTYGKLMEVEIDPTKTDEPEWKDHGFLAGTEMAPDSTPCAVTDDESTFISVFARAENGHLVESFYNGEQWQWIDHGTPKEGVSVNFDPAPPIYGHNSLTYSAISVFVSGSDGLLYEFSRSPDIMVGKWHDHPKPFNVSIASSPYAIYSNLTDNYEIRTRVFVKGQDGQLYELDCKAVDDNRSDKWKNHLSPKSAKVDSRPVAQKYELVNSGNFNGYHAKVFVRGTDDALWEFDTVNTAWGMYLFNIDAAEFEEDLNNGIISGELKEKFETEGFPLSENAIVTKENDDKWMITDGEKIYILKKEEEKLYIYDEKSLGVPDEEHNIKVNSDPHGYIENPGWVDGCFDSPQIIFSSENKHIFVRGTDDCLWVRNDLGWISHQAPANSKLIFSPFVLPMTDDDTILHIFSASNQNSIVERKTGLVKIYKAATGGTTSTITFDDSASAIDDFYNGMHIKITEETVQIRMIIDYDGSTKVATVDSDWDTKPGYESQYLMIGYDSKIWNEYKDPNETALTPTLSWEYWNKKGWVVLKGIKDETVNLLKDGQITFDLPEDIEETEIAGQKSYWIRAGIVGGDYGKETFSLAIDMSQRTDTATREQKLLSTKSSIRPPIVNSLAISYSVESKQYPQKCMTYNNLEYLDQTDACKEEDKHFSPFVQLKDKERTLYLGFENSFKGGPVKIFFAAEELPLTEAKKPKVEWSYRAKNDWGELSYLDATEGLIKADILELQGPADFSGHSRFGIYLYWIKGSLIKGEYEESPLLDGIHPNTTWAFQAETIKDEILGSSDGEPDQTFSFLKFPVLKGEEIRVREILFEEEKQKIVKSFGEDAIHEEKDETGKVTETWVLWKEVPDFFDSKPTDRHYRLDRATGELQFGDLITGMIPAVGDDNIKAFSYQAGGGAPGNVKAGEIKTLKSAVAGVDKVSNPVAADGGADTATVDQMLEIGPAKISHRNRAVTAEDFEWLAKEASRKVVKVRCLPNTNNKKHTEVGWVTLIIVPDSLEDQPKPSLELKRKVQKYLEACCANTLTSGEHIFVDGPSYVEIGVSVDVFVTSIDVVSEVEREVRTKLKAFFHPLTGSAEGKGWDFGRDVAVSDIYVLLEEIKGVDHVENLTFTYGTREPPRKSQSVEPLEIVSTGKDLVEVERDCLVATGTHSINIQLKKGGLT